MRAHEATQTHLQCRVGSVGQEFHEPWHNVVLNNQIDRWIRFLREQLSEFLCRGQLIFHVGAVQGLNRFRLDQRVRICRLGFIL